VSVEPYHLFRYLDEQAWRFNNRKLTDGERFSAAVSGTVGKRLTYDQLTGNDPSPKIIFIMSDLPLKKRQRGGAAAG